jgi:hypothetical protein
MFKYLFSHVDLKLLSLTKGCLVVLFVTVSQLILPGCDTKAYGGGLKTLFGM